MSQYSGLNRAQLSYDYLHTNSTTHEFLFGALAELVDNARDASATKCNIYSVADSSLRGGYMLCILDDGEGMDPEEAHDIVTFGRSMKKSVDSQLIGMYGNGLKSGSMRIGNDLMIFTKKGPTMTSVLLSRTFHEQEKIDEIIVPMPTFESTNKKPKAKTQKEKEKHQIEMGLILKYSPFKKEADVFKEFDKIEGTAGTLIIIYNLKLLDTGEPELDIKSDANDIILSNPDSADFDSDEGFQNRLMPERRSFRAYTSVLYVDPRMRIYIQGKKVRTKRLVHCLYKPRLYKYSSSRFKTRSESEAKKAQEEAKSAEHRARESESKARNLENKMGSGGNKEQRAELRKTQAASMELRKEAQLKKQIAERKIKSLRDPKALNFIFGVNIANRNQDGMFIYNCSRLIKMYQKVGPQADGGVFCSGVVGIVDVPYMVLEPTHNKQDFADAKEFRHLQKAMGEHLVQYWKDVGIAQQGVTKFWESFGYLSSNWKDSPSSDTKFVRKRSMQLQTSVQCDLCLKWRILPFSTNNIGKTFPDDWVCGNNQDPSHNRCSASEQKLNIMEGVLKKESKTQDQKQKDLAEEIKKKQDQLDKMQKTKVITSSKQLRKMEIEEDEEEEEEEEEDVKPKVKGRKVEADGATRVITLMSRENSIKRPAPESTRKVAATSSRASMSPRVSVRPSSSRRLSKRHVSESEEEEPEEEPEDTEEDDEPAPPPPKRKPPTSKAAVRPTRAPATQSSRRTPILSRARITAAATESESSEAEEKPTLTRRTARGKKQELFKTEESEEDEEMAEAPEPDEGMPDDTAEQMGTDGDIGTRVEAKVQSKWYAGVVTQVSKQTGKIKVKFDKYPNDKADKWFEQGSSDLKVTKANSQSVAESTVGAPQSPASVSSHDAANETPSSSTPAAGTSMVMSQASEDIANGYRTCLRYFLPPQWVMDKDAVSALGINELASFPLDDFFDHYEKGLRKLVSSFQLEAQAKQQEAEGAKSKLSTVRKMIAKLLKSINEEFDIDPECDTEQVDELLAACVKQALQDQSTS